MKNIDEIRYSIACYCPKIILLSETRTTKDIEDSELRIDHYRCIRCDSDSRHTGGVLIYVKNEYAYSCKKICKLDSNYWCVFVRVEFISSVWNIGCLYHSPSSSDAAFVDGLEDIFDSVFCGSKKCVLVGDFNVNLLGSGFYSVKLKKLIATYGINQIISEPTRVTDTSETLVDYVLTNYENIIAEVHDIPKITDHSIITVNLPNVSVAVERTKKYRDMSESNLNNMKSELMLCKWNLDSSNVDDIYREILLNCEGIIESVAPIRTCNYKSSLPWFDNELCDGIRDRDRAYKIFKKATVSEKQIKWQTFKRIRNQVVNMLRVKKERYYYNKIDMYRDNPREMWKTLQKLINSKNNGTPNCITFEANNEIRVCRDDHEIAENFNKYFLISVKDVVASITACNTRSFLNYNLYQAMSKFERVTMADLRDAVRSLDRKFSLYETLNSRFLKEVFEVIGHVILNFVNSSLSSGRIPNQLKSSVIIPIQKINNTNKACEFRPINKLPPIEKLLEKIVYKQVLNHVISNSILINNQSAFRGKHSCESALQLTVNRIKTDIDNNKYVVGVFLDLKRAFETIDRDVLLHKLQTYGITGGVLDWFRDYLRSRGQRVQFNNSLSGEAENGIGVPQGSILGPLLFILYLNDIEIFIECEFINLFADDTFLACSDTNLNRAVQKMNLVLDETSKYLSANKLKLNVSKTKGIIFTKKYLFQTSVQSANINLQVDGEVVEIVPYVKYLGCQLDFSLSFGKHFEYIQRKVAKKLYFFSRIASSLSIQTRICVYNTIIQPHFDFCASILYMFNMNQMQGLQKLQNRGMRVILRASRYTPISSMLKVLNWFPVQKRIYFLTMVFIYKIINHLAPQYFDSLINFNRDVHGYGTRYIDNIYIARTNYKSSMNSLFFKGFQDYNNLPTEVKLSNSLSVFKRNLKMFMYV